MKTIKQLKKLFPLLDQGIVSGGNFFLGVILARVLGLEGYGEYTLVWFVILFCSSINQAWIISPLYTFAPQYKKKEKTNYIRSVLSHQIIFALSAALLVYLLVIVSSLLLPRWQIARASHIVSLIVFCFLMYDFFRRLHYVQGNVSKALTLDVLVYSSQMGGLIVLTYLHKLSLYNAFMTVSISYGLTFLLEYKACFLLNIDRKAIRKTALQHWRYSRWLIGTSLLQWVSGNFFIISAGGMLGPIVVGAIRMLQNIMGVIHILFLALENQVPLKASHLYANKGLQAMYAYLKKVAIRGSLITLLMACTIALLGKQIISLLYAGKHLAYASFLYAFGGLYVLVFIGTCLRFAIRTLEKTKAIFFAYVWSTLFSILSANFIIKQFQMSGILIGLFATQLIMQGYFIYSLKGKSQPYNLELTNMAN